MADEPNRVEQLLDIPPAEVRRFHIGNMPQAGIPPDPSEEEVAALEAHQAQIKVPEARPPYGVDEEGNPRDAPAAESQPAPGPSATERRAASAASTASSASEQRSERSR